VCIFVCAMPCCSEESHLHDWLRDATLAVFFQSLVIDAADGAECKDARCNDHGHDGLEDERLAHVMGRIRELICLEILADDDKQAA